MCNLNEKQHIAFILISSAGTENEHYTIIDSRNSSKSTKCIASIRCSCGKSIDSAEKSFCLCKAMGHVKLVQKHESMKPGTQNSEQQGSLPNFFCSWMVVLIHCLAYLLLHLYFLKWWHHMCSWLRNLLRQCPVVQKIYNSMHFSEHHFRTSFFYRAYIKCFRPFGILINQTIPKLPIPKSKFFRVPLFQTAGRRFNK